MGTLMTKIHGQLRTSVRMPPSSRPKAPPAPAMAPQTPMARVRSLPSAKVVVMIDSAAGETSAAPRPCTPRAKISTSPELARALAADAALKSAMPIRNSLRRPMRSAARPPRSRKPPNIRVYALTIHCSCSVVRSRSVWIDGRATLTIVASSTTMNWAKQTTTRAAQRARAERASGMRGEGLLVKPDRGVRFTVSKRTARSGSCDRDHTSLPSGSAASLRRDVVRRDLGRESTAAGRSAARAPGERPALAPPQGGDADAGQRGVRPQADLDRLHRAGRAPRRPPAERHARRRAVAGSPRLAGTAPARELRPALRGGRARAAAAGAGDRQA